MEISVGLKTDILSVQGELVKAIQDHTILASKLKEFPNSEIEIKQDLFEIQRLILQLNDKQKLLLQQLRIEIKENTCQSGIVSGYNFNLYKIKPGQLETKKNRRKDLNLATKVVSCRPTHSPPSLSPSPTPSSSSSLSDDSIDYISPFMLPVPVPKARPMLLPDIKENPFLENVSRRDLRQSKLKRNQKNFSDEEVFKDIPIYNDPLPSPPPTDKKNLKERFMTALSLIPKEMHIEILNRKVERKRRSTATNNPNFVYNNDWELLPWKRSRTYLSPHKIDKIDISSKKIKAEEASDSVVSVLSSRQARKDREEDCDKSDRFSSEAFGADKSDSKSMNTTPDSTGSNLLCFVCRTSGPVNACKYCSICYHTSCVSPNSSISCPCCKNKRSSPDGGSSEKSSKEEFVSKCPNVAESYSKLKEYIENHTDSDTAALYAERENFKVELMAKNQELYNQKRDLEEKATEMSEALLLQENAKNNLLKEEEKILAKIKVITDFVVLYQKNNLRKVECRLQEIEEEEASLNENAKEMGNFFANEKKFNEETINVIEEPDPKDREEKDKIPEELDENKTFREGENDSEKFFENTQNSPERNHGEKPQNNPLSSPKGDAIEDSTELGEEGETTGIAKGEKQEKHRGNILCEIESVSIRDTLTSDCQSQFRGSSDCKTFGEQE